jgi:hypothetical protein
MKINVITEGKCLSLGQVCCRSVKSDHSDCPHTPVLARAYTRAHMYPHAHGSPILAGSKSYRFEL